jgi:hypothetical protein
MALSIKPVMYLVLVLSSYFADEHLLNDNRDRVIGFYWSSKCDVSLLVHNFSWTYNTNQVAVITIDKYLIIKKKSGKGSGHIEHHEKVVRE